MSLIIVSKEWCKKCRICIDLCPSSALTSDEEGYPRLIDENLCTKCKLCELRCPDFAIEVKEEVNV
ncbi:MAG TPA: 4Fe-4S dicluster domain-containing protein [Candidatus Atribacteria bacterium]|nr:4Fe-4S dicluster domain-containing protein [Candidatus Atribacteria bacterium]